jgi:hypothetical protein
MVGFLAISSLLLVILLVVLLDIFPFRKKQKIKFLKIIRLQFFIYFIEKKILKAFVKSLKHIINLILYLLSLISKFLIEMSFHCLIKRLQLNYAVFVDKLLFKLWYVAS